MNYLISFFSLFLFLKSCQPDMDTIRVTIDHYRAPCSGEAIQLCMRVKHGESKSDWEYFYDQIEGFSYEPGYIYELEVEKEEIPNPPQDGSSIKWVLKKIISKTQVPDNTEFELPLQGNGMSYIEEEGCRFLYEWPIQANEENCQKLMNAQKGIFRHSNPPGELVLVKIL
ncbi:MAG: DUF4377 domain-containing protein [Bacteroidia bacterium]